MKDAYTKKWIIDNSLEIVEEYEKGILTLRGLHYQLVGRGMTNDIQHYKRVVSAMIDARWSGDVDFDTFSDLDRSIVGETPYLETDLDDKIDQAKQQLKAWMTSYYKNKWENQPVYPEVFIEKKALQGVFGGVCRDEEVALGACKGYPSLTFLHDSFLRFKEAQDNGKTPIIIYFGDYDPSGEDIPRSIQENLFRFGVDVEIRRIALMEFQVIDWNLPPAPTKQSDSRAAKWNGLGQVELDAVRPEKLMKMCKDAIDEVFDHDLFELLRETETDERVIFRRELKSFVNDELVS